MYWDFELQCLQHNFLNKTMYVSEYFRAELSNQTGYILGTRTKNKTLRAGITITECGNNCVEQEHDCVQHIHWL